MLRAVAILLDHSSRRPERRFPNWHPVRLCCDENLASLTLAHLLIQISCWVLPGKSLAMPFPPLLLPAGWNASQPSLSLIHHWHRAKEEPKHRQHTKKAMVHLYNIYCIFLLKKMSCGKKKCEKAPPLIQIKLGISPATLHGFHQLCLLWVQTFTLLLCCRRHLGHDPKEIVL